MTAYRPIQALIDIEALKHNLMMVKAFAPNSKVMAIIKANGYGHGIIRVAQQLTAADAYGVASIDEAIVLRHQGFLHRIILLEGLFSEEELSLAITHRLDFVVHSFHQLEWLKTLDKNTPINLWVKFDTGMHRLGFDIKDELKVRQAINQLACPVHLQLISHLASADCSPEFTQKQFDAFEQIADHWPCSKSLANSAAIQLYPQSHLQWVRPGIMLYGACSFKPTTPDLKPVMTLKSQITSLKWIESGESVGYGNQWTAEQKTLVAVVAVGYGDGYPRHAPNGTPVLVHGEKMPLIGRVSMDMITVDVTALSETVSVGDTAILWGAELSVDEVAESAGTIGYELLCAVTKRVPRIEI